MKKLLVILLIYNSMGFAVVQKSGVICSKQEQSKTYRPRVYIEIASPNAYPVTLYASGK